MTDERFAFIQDVRERKITAQSARHKRAHCGKGGAVKFPSDYLSQKKLRALSGEVKSYRLNDPMNWAEFKAMPDDIKADYIRALRERFNVSDSHIADMFGCHKVTLCNYLKTIGCPSGPHRGKYTQWDDAGWFAWVNGISLTGSAQQAEEAPASEPVQEVQTLPACAEKAIPRSGRLDFEGPADTALNTISALLGGASVNVTITWEVCPEEGAAHD